MKIKAILSLMAIMIGLINTLFAQAFEYKIHDRGMLHETVFNDGTIGRPWQTGEAGNTTSTPIMEWPPHSSTVVNGIKYSGQHNILGAGMYMAANLDGQPGKEDRIYALCGGVGASTPEQVVGVWSFPLSMEEIHNYPVLDTGELNPDYDPNEAEEIIIAKWATSVGVTVTRTSRAFSHPDFDDMIIYEYDLEYTGDTDGDPATIEQTTTLKDFMALFIYGFAPSMYGYQRQYQEWKYEAGIYRGDQNNFWDADYWLSFNLNLRTNLKEEWAKPEPDSVLFRHNAETGNMGGGLNSPQAPGFCTLFYDTNHLAVIDPVDANRNESEYVRYLRTNLGAYFEIDEQDHMKQPFSNKVSTGNTRSSKMKDFSINPDSRWSGVYSEGSTTWPEIPNYDTRWYGRAAYNYRQSVDAGQKHIVFGPYTLEHGEKLEYSFAEVVGYGAQPGKRIEGGPATSSGALVQWNNTPSWDRKVMVNGEAWTTNGYLTDYGYPDYVNSEVQNVTQVAQKAFEAYLGEPAEEPVWPEDNPRDGAYQIPILVPAPAIIVDNTEKATIKITWSRAVEDFDVEGQTGALDHFVVYKALSGMGPWTPIETILNGEVNSESNYQYDDEDQDFKIGEVRYYAVTSVDEFGNESGKTNIIRHEKNVRSVDEMTKVYAVPNPFILNSGFQGDGDEVAEQIGFYRLPAECTIRIFSYSGQLVETIRHNNPVYSTAWFQVTRSEQDIASGIYFYVVTTPAGDQTSGKLVIVK